MCNERYQTPCDRRCPNSPCQDENEVIRDIDFYQEIETEYEEERLQERERKSIEEIF